MLSSNTTTDLTPTVIRWAARISSILFLGGFAFMFTRWTIDPSTLTTREWLSLLFFPIGASIGMILAWWKEGLGGALTLVSVFVCVLIHDASAGGAYTLTCASPGLLFVLSWLLSVMRPDPGEASAPLDGML
jgi:hypothetical protein